MKKTRLTLDKNAFRDFLANLISSVEIPKHNTLSLDITDFKKQFGEVKIDAPDIQIAMTTEAYAKMMTLVQRCDKEIAWHGFVVSPEENQYVIVDISVYPQRITAATVEADEASYGEWMTQFSVEHLNSMLMQGHSHVNMGVFASATDQTYYDEILSQIKNYYIFMIVNKSGEINLKMYDKQNNVLYEEIPLLIYTRQKEYMSLKEWYDEQYAKVKSYTYVYDSKIATKKTEITEENAAENSQALEYYNTIYGRRM